MKHFFLKEDNCVDLERPEKSTEVVDHSLETLSPCAFSKPRLVAFEHILQPIFPEPQMSQG